MPSVRIALLSDLHFYVAGETSSVDSYLPLTTSGEIEPHQRGAGKNPWDDLLTLVSSDNLSCDVVLCAGDLTCRAEQRALKAGWQSLVELGKALGAVRVCSATGNHDVSSRSNKDKISQNSIRELPLTRGPIESLKLLSPAYPVHELSPLADAANVRHMQTKYFGESFVILDDDPRYRLILLNTCCEHGHDPHEFERGTVPESVLQWIRKDVQIADDGRINLLLCHHPLLSQSHDGGAYDFQQRGDLLVETLDASGAWLMFHGHKHYAQLNRAPSGTNRQSVIFSLASFAARLEAPFTGGKDNQFYIVDVDVDSQGRIRGVVQAWNWNVGKQWTRAAPGDDGRVFYGCGFGSALDPTALASAIAEAFDAGIRSWSDVMTRVEELKYTMPSAMKAVRTQLKNKHRLDIECNDLGWFTTIARTP